MNRLFLALLALVLAFPLAGCQSRGVSSSDTLKIGAYSVVREVIHDGLIPAFAARWKSKTGREVQFEESYNASGAQARSIASGFDADLAILSHVGDMEILVKDGKVKSDWNSGPHRGILTHSLVVIGHRPGNPKQIQDWADLGRPGVGVLYPDPKTSGGARWNINAIYGAALLAATEAGKGQADLASVRDLMARIQANVINMDQSGRQSMANFAERQTGDAVVTYENELLLREQGRRADSLRDSPFHTADRESRGDRREFGRAARQSSSRGGVSRVPALGRGSADLRRLRVPARQPRSARRRPACRPVARESSSPWPIWEAGPRSRKSSTVPTDSGPTIAAERSQARGR